MNAASKACDRGTGEAVRPFRRTMVATSSSPGLIKRLGPGVITGAADDDPSGIATYSQAGAQAGFGLLWTVVLTWPLMVAVQSVSARIGRVTGRGLAANMCRTFPRPVVTVAVLLLFVANTINIGADLAAINLLVPWGRHGFTLAFAVVSLLAIVFVPYHRYVGFLKWLTFSLFAYVGVVFTAELDWTAVAAGAVVPRFALDGETLMLVVAVAALAGLAHLRGDGRGGRRHVRVDIGRLVLRRRQHDLVEDRLRDDALQGIAIVGRIDH